MNKPKLFAIVDIETTGNYAGGSKVTEIAIIIHNGKKIIEEYQSLINPQQPIPYQIQVLTGIDNEMVADAPTFAELAEDIYHLLQGKIFVAHNVNFDYSFIVKELKAAGYDWQANKLCTVRLSRKLFPGYGSYSLGKLCLQRNIPLSDRHRAMGDAKATAILFEQLILADDGMVIAQNVLKNTESRLPTQLSLAQYQALPETAGIYIFRDKQDKIIYIGKAINIKKRVLSHFTGNNTGLRRQQFIQDIHDIAFEESGSELMALLMECTRIKKHWPIHNRALKKYEPKFALIHYQDVRGYERLAVAKVNQHTTAIQYFETANEANQLLQQLMEKYLIDKSLCTFYSPATVSKADRMQVQTTLPDVAAQQHGVSMAIEAVQSLKKSFLIIDAGRNPEEQSYIYFKDNKLYAFGFVDQANEHRELADIVAYQDKCISNYYMEQLVVNYAAKHPTKLFMLPKTEEELA